MHEQRLVSEKFCAEIERYFRNILMPVRETLPHISKHFSQAMLIGQRARDDAHCSNPCLFYFCFSLTGLNVQWQ